MSAFPPPSTGPDQPRRAATGPLRTVLLHTRGIITSQHARHVAMFWAILTSMLMAFVGYEFLWGWLEPHQHFYRFALYWIICGWLTILAALLAIYEILVNRLQLRLQQRVLREKMLRDEILRHRGED